MVVALNDLLLVLVSLESAAIQLSGALHIESPLNLGQAWKINAKQS